MKIPINSLVLKLQAVGCCNKDSNCLLYHTHRMSQYFLRQVLTLSSQGRRKQSGEKKNTHKCLAVCHDLSKTRKHRVTEVVGHNSVPVRVNVTSTLNFQTPPSHSYKDLSFNVIKLINSVCRNFRTCLQAPTPILILPAALNFEFPA
jgi:hypothetical protein